MASNGIHIFELLLVDITVSPRLALRLIDLSTSNLVELIGHTVLLFLLASLFQHLGLDFSGLISYAIHDLLSLYAEIRFRPLEAEVESGRVHVDRQRAPRLRWRFLAYCCDCGFGRRRAKSRGNIAETAACG